MAKYEKMVWEDGNYTLTQMNKIVFDKFNSEKEMKSFLIKNLYYFSKEVFDDEIIRFQDEYKISDGKKKNKSLDIFCVTKKGQKIAIELKNPTYKSELQAALGQCMTYITSIEMSGVKIDRMILVSSVYDILIPLTIKKFNLPIEFVVMDKGKISKMEII